MITVYDNRCTPCTRKELWRKVKEKAREQKQSLFRKDVSKDIKARANAQNMGMEFPFLVLDDEIMTVEEFLA